MLNIFSNIIKKIIYSKYQKNNIYKSSFSNFPLKNFNKFPFITQHKKISSNLKKNFTTKNIDIHETSTPTDIVTPWEVKGKVDYMKLVNQFGTELIDNPIIEKIENLTQTPIHPWIKRNIFFTHRGLNTIIEALEKNENIFLYTGRGPSSNSLHLGHLIPFIFTKWLQETLKCTLVIQISDEEKFAFKKKDFQEIYNYGRENSKDIASIGFDPESTFIFSNREYRLKCQEYEILTSNLKIHTNSNEIKKIFGFNDESTIAMYDWPFYQTAAAFYQSYPNIFKNIPAYCLVPHAIDQDPYFRLARDLSVKIDKYKLIKPSSIMSKFVPPLTGVSGKMSSSTGEESTIFLNDSEKDIKEKIFKYSFSGGGGNGSLQDHKKYGGNTEKDMAFQYLKYFEFNDIKLEEIRIAFYKGEMSCVEIKEILCEKIITLISEIQENRKKITDEFMNSFYSDMNKKNNYDNNKNSFQENLIFSPKQEEMLNILCKYEVKDFIVKFHGYLSIKENEIELKNMIRGNLVKTLFLKGAGNQYYLMLLDYDELVDIKFIKKKMKFQSLKFGENDTIQHLFGVKRSEFGFISALELNLVKDKVFSILISEKIKFNKYLNFPFLSENSHISVKYDDVIRIIKANNINYSIV